MKRILFVLALLSCASLLPGQTVVVNILLYGLDSGSGTGPLPGDRLIQFVNLGANGVFDPVPAGAWVGGDDQLVTLPVLNPMNISLPPEFPTAAAFDAWMGPDGPPGTAERVLVFDTLPDGVYGARWWPAYRPSDYYAGVTPAAGATYGQFTRLSGILHNGMFWRIEGPANYTFDALGTASWGGGDPNSAGYSSQRAGGGASVSVAVPAGSPAWLLAAALGLAALSARFHRKRATPYLAVPGRRR